MKIYVAGSSAEIPRVQKVMQALRDLGHEIAHDWTAVIEKRGGANNVSDAVSKETALDDLTAIEEADAMLALSGSGPASRGMWFELGFAYSFSTPVVLVGSPATIFADLADLRYATDAEGVEHFRGAFAHPRDDEDTGASTRH